MIFATRWNAILERGIHCSENYNFCKASTKSGMGKIEAPGDKSLEFFGLLSRYFDGEASVEEIAKAAGLSTRTVWRRIKAHQEKGLDGLQRLGRADKGKRRKISAPIQEVVEGLYLRTPKPTVVWIHEQLVQVCEQQKVRPPSYWMVWEICRNLDDRLKVLAHQGDEAYEQIYDLIIRRQSERPNHMWQGDHKELKIWAVDEQGRVGKVWLTGIVDDYSRVVPGYFLGVGPANSMRIASALRQAIWVKSDDRWPVCGIPEVFYTDRGKDFKSTHIEQAAADLGIRLVKTKRKKPRGKGKIERFFRTADLRFATRQKSTFEKPVDLQQLRATFHEWLMTDYHQRMHSEIKAVPMVKWKESNILPRLPDSAEALDLMLQKVAKPRRMWRDGIRFNNHRYSDMTLSESVGQEFTIRYDPRDASSIWIYAEQGNFLCKASCAELSGQTLEPRAIFKERARVKRELKGQVKKRLNAASDFVREGEVKLPAALVPLSVETPARRLRRHFHERNQ